MAEEKKTQGAPAKAVTAVKKDEVKLLSRVLKKPCLVVLDRSTRGSPVFEENSG